MKKFATAILLAALLPLGGCVVYGPGPAANPAWANYDHSYDYGLSGYDRPVIYRSGYGGYAGGAGYADAYGAGYDVNVGAGGPGFYGSYYSYGGY